MSFCIFLPCCAVAGQCVCINFASGHLQVPTSWQRTAGEWKLVNSTSFATLVRSHGNAVFQIVTRAHGREIKATLQVDIALLKMSASSDFSADPIKKRLSASECFILLWLRKILGTDDVHIQIL
jgi:hypothetical protein